MATTTYSTFPPEVPLADGLSKSLIQPDAVVGEGTTGPRQSIAYRDAPRLNYSASFDFQRFDGDRLERLEAFFERVRVLVDPFFLIEPLTTRIRRAIAGPHSGDGSTTTFLLPFLNDVVLTGVDVYLEGVVQSDAQVTLHQSSNVVPTDADFNGDGGIHGAQADSVSTTLLSTTAALTLISRNDAIAGITAFVFYPAAAAAGHYIKQTAIPVTVGQVYTATVALDAQATGNHTVAIDWKTSGGGSAGTSASATVNVAATGQRYLTVTGTAPATSVTAHVSMTRDVSAAAPLIVGGFALSPGNRGVFQRPSCANALAEFVTAPADLARVRASGLGKRVVLVEHKNAVYTWTLYDLGTSAPGRLEAVEVVI